MPISHSTSTLTQAIALALTFLGTASCGELKPCPGAEMGEKLQLEILGQSEDHSANPSVCDDAWGFVVGAVITGEIVDLRGQGDCKSGALKVAGLGGWTWKYGEGGMINGGSTLDTSYAISNGLCTASLILQLSGSASDAFCDASVDDRCAMKLLIVPDNGDKGSTCPEFCSTYLDVRPKRL